MERIMGFMTPWARQATVALADEGNDNRPVTGRVAITEAAAPRSTAGGAPGHSEGIENNLRAVRAALGREISEEPSPTPSALRSRHHIPPRFPFVRDPARASPATTS